MLCETNTIHTHKWSSRKWHSAREEGKGAGPRKCEIALKSDICPWERRRKRRRRMGFRGGRKSRLERTPRRLWYKAMWWVTVKIVAQEHLIIADTLILRFLPFTNDNNYLLTVLEKSEHNKNQFP